MSTGNRCGPIGHHSYGRAPGRGARAQTASMPPPPVRTRRYYKPANEAS